MPDVGDTEQSCLMKEKKIIQKCITEVKNVISQNPEIK